MKQLFLGLVLLVLTGCSYLPSVVDAKIKINDSKLQAAELVMCGDVSDGALYRRYGLNSKRAIGRRNMCGYTGGDTVIK